MLRKVPKIVFLSPILEVEEDTALSAATAGGMGADLAELMGRLGHVRASALSGEGETAWERGELDAADPRVLEVLTAGRSSDFAVVLRCRGTSDRLVLLVSMFRQDGTLVWGGETVLADEGLPSSRLALVADLIEAATGWRKDTRRFGVGGAKLLKAYLLCCAARAPGLLAASRVALLSEASSLDPDYLEAALLLADAHEADHADEDALAVLADVCARAPSYAPGRMHYGILLRASGDDAVSLNEVQAALEADPEGQVLYEAGLFAAADGDSETAEQLFSAAQERGYQEGVISAQRRGTPRADDPQSWLLQGIAARDARRWDDAVHAFSEVRRLGGPHPQACSEQALAMLALGRGDEALELARAAHEQAPRDAALLSNLGLVLMEIGALADARALFVEARGLNPRDPIVVACRAELEQRIKSASRAAIP